MWLFEGLAQIVSAPLDLLVWENVITDAIKDIGEGIDDAFE